MKNIKRKSRGSKTKTY